MSKLSAFLNPVSAEQEREVVISNRFQDEHGDPMPFKIRAIMQEENDKIVKSCTRRMKNGEETVDTRLLSRKLVVAATVEPDFRAKEMCDRYATLDPLEVPGKMLLVGEYNKLVQAIMELSGLDDTPDEIEDEIKN